LYRYPAPFAHLVIEFGSPSRLIVGREQRSIGSRCGGYVAGPGDQFMRVEPTGHQRIVLVNFTCTAARRFLGIPLSELEHGIVYLQDLPARPFESFPAVLSSAPDWSTRFDLVEELLMRRILGAQLDTARVDYALARLQSRKGSLKIAALAKELGCSHKHLVSLFHDQVGVCPKLMARLQRLHGAVCTLGRAGDPVSLARLAVHHGYSDQAHLAREMKQLTGLTPRLARSSQVGSGFVIG
jgi:AraC-like DNA-binding protein